MTLGVISILAIGAVAVWLIWPKDSEPEPSDSPSPTPSETQPDPSPTPEPSPPPSEEPTTPPPAPVEISIVGTSAFFEPIEELVSQHDTPVTVEPIGIGAGLEAFGAGQSHVVMALPGLGEDQLSIGGGACVVPTETYQFLVTAKLTYISFNVDGVEELVLDAPTLAAIYSGTITNWNDPAIAALNPDATFPDLAIQPLHRSEGTQISDTFQRWLVAATDGAWAEAGPDWTGEVGEGVPSGSDMAAKLRSTAGTIGYVEYPDLQTPAASLVVGDESINPHPENVQGHLDAAVLAPSTPLDPLAAGAYPLTDFGYLMTCLEYEDPEIGSAVRGFLQWSLSPDGQEIFAESTSVVITHTTELDKAGNIR